MTPGLIGAPPLASRDMHSVGQIDWSFMDRPAPASAMSSGLARLRIVGPEQGAIHTDLAVVGLGPGGWLAPHVHAFEEALYVLDGDLLLELGGQVHRLVDRRLRADPDRSAARAGQRVRRAGSAAVAQQPAAARPRGAAARHVLRTGGGPGRDGCRRGPAAVRRSDASAGRPLRRHAAAARGAPRGRPRARPGTGRDGHRDPRLQRDLGEDAGRPRVRGRPRHDVHRRLRTRRRRAGPRPPVRGGLRLPRRRDRR